MVPLLTSVLVRWLHLLAMAVAVGGGALAWGVSHTADAETTRTVATTYETAFWGAIGVLVMTGVGNLGALAPAIPRVRWGVTLVGKLGLVVVFLVGSAVRTATVRAARRTDVPTGTAPIERGYALTTVTLVAIVGLGVVLAHG